MSILSKNSRKRKLIDKFQVFWYNRSIMKKITAYSISSFIASSVVILLAQAPVFAANIFNGGMQSGIEQGRTSEMPTTLFGNAGIFTQIVNVMLFLVGILSVIMLIFGGLRYVISRGESKAVEAAKNTILYAIVGLIVSILSYAIVNFVVTSFAGSNGAVNGCSNSTNGVPPTNV